MQVPLVDDNHLLPEIMDKVSLQILEETRLSSIAHAEHKNALRALRNAGTSDDKAYWRRKHIIHNAKAIAHAGKSLEALFQLLKGLIKDERLSRRSGGVSHSLVAAYEECLAALDDGEKRKNLEHAFECAYYEVVCKGTTEIHDGDEVRFGWRQTPFHVIKTMSMQHGKPVYEQAGSGRYVENMFKEGARQEYKGCPPKFIEYLELFDGVAESFEKNGGDWKAQGKSWRYADYLPREDLGSTTVINADFFGDLIHSLTSMLSDRHFWHERFLDRMLDVSRILQEDKVRMMVKQSWPEDVSKEVLPKLVGTIDLSGEKDMCLSAPLQSKGNLDFIRKHNTRVYRIGQTAKKE